MPDADLKRHDEQAKCDGESVSDRQLSPAQRRQRQTAALKHGAYAAEYGARLRQRRLRDRVGSLLKSVPALQGKPRHLVQRYIEVDAIAATLFNVLFTDGPVNGDGEPKRLLSEYRYLMAELRTLASTLGLLSPDDADPLAALMAGGTR